MKIALAQINSTLGDFEANRKKIEEMMRRAKERRCDLVVFPELALFGYSPMDLLERESVVETQLAVLKKITKNVPEGLGVLVGVITPNKKKRGRSFHNSAAFLVKNKAPRFFHKTLLPNYDVFDENRHFESGDVRENVLVFKGHKILVTICEDMWGWGPLFNGRPPSVNPLETVKTRGLDLIVNLSASPFAPDKFLVRKKLATKAARFFKAPFVYVNMVGAEDELIFDGGSFAIDQKGHLFAQGMFFDEDLTTLYLDGREGGIHAHTEERISQIHQALVLGIRDFVHKTGFQRVHLGLSGGIDSAVVAALAVDALGPSNVTGFLLPSPYTSQESNDLAHRLAQKLGCQTVTVPIEPAYAQLKEQVDRAFDINGLTLTHENMQARLRGLILMAYSNAAFSLLLTTGNKSEYATGYCTLYGDMCGGLAPIGDLLKTQVYELAAYYNREHEMIPKPIVERAPTAELRPNQKDQDSLPPYSELDKAVSEMVVERKAARTEQQKWVLTQLYKSEFKRWQAPPILKVSSHSFGRGRRLPIAHRAKS